MNRIFAKLLRKGKVEYVEVYQMSLFNPGQRETGSYQVGVYRKDYGCCREDMRNIEIILASHPEYLSAMLRIDSLEREGYAICIEEADDATGEPEQNNRKEVVLDYCNTVKTHDIDHLQNCLDNKRWIEEENYNQLSGCPSNYGLDDYVGLCEIEDVGQDYQKQCEQCERCWKQALDV